MSDSTTLHYGFIQPENFGSINSWGPKLNGDLSSIDTFLWAASQGTTIGVNEISSATSVTLTNPINNIQDVNFTAATQKLILSAMNATASMVKGGSIIINNTGANAFGVYANDTTTAIITSLPVGQSAILTLRTNSTANGTFTANQFITIGGTPLLAANDLADVVSAGTSLANLGGLSAATAATTYAPLASPAFTGTPTAPTATPGTGGTQIATQAYADASAVDVTYNAISGNLPTAISGTSTTAAVTISAGQATNSANTKYIVGAGYSWAVSNGNAINGYSGGTTLPNNTTIHFFLCNGTTGTGSFSSNSLTPTFPPGYTTNTRRIFSLNTGVGGALIPVTPIETEGGSLTAYLATPTTDVSTTTLGTSRILYTLNAPIGIKVGVLYRVAIDTTAGASILLTSGDEPDNAPNTFQPAPGCDGNFYGGASFPFSTPRDGLLTTDTSGRIGARSSSGSTGFYFMTRGWKDFRIN